MRSLTNDSEILDLVSDAVEHFVLSHAFGRGVLAKPDDDQALVLAEDGLVDVPAAVEVGEDNRSHVVVLTVFIRSVDEGAFQI